MKKIVLAVFMAAMALSLSAQINFREGGFAEALEAAKSENKLVFMDCYTSWCGPCKLMASKEFVQEKAGEYFNPRFVSVKIDMEKGEGVELRKRYDVNAYPTLLVLNVKIPSNQTMLLPLRIQKKGAPYILVWGPQNYSLIALG